MKQHTFSSSTLVLGLWLLQGLLMGILCLVNPNHYTTIDSHYYLQGAQSIIEGKGYQILEDNEWTWNGHFPPFYSICIAIIAFIFKIPVLWASKLVNWLVAGWLLLIVGKSSSIVNPLLVAILLCSGICLKLWVHTWSEPLFICLLLLWIHYYVKGIQTHFWQLVLIGCLIILTRYVGGFLIVFVLIHGLFIQRSEKNKVFLLGLTWSLFGVVLLSLNYYLSGELYGGPRFQEPTSIVKVMKELSLALLNEVLLFRDIMERKYTWLTMIGILIQVLFFYKMSTYFAIPNRRGFPFIQIGVVYLLCLTILRIGSSFGPLNYRLLAPFTVLILLAGFNNMRIKKGDPLVVYKWVTFFIIMSWLHLLPHAYQK